MINNSMFDFAATVMLKSIMLVYRDRNGFDVILVGRKERYEFICAETSRGREEMVSCRCNG